MSDLTNFQGGAAVTMTMTSYEIAELVDQRHDNVKRTIETLAARGTIALPQSEEVPNPGPGPKTIKVYRVGKRDSYVIVAQLSPEFTARLVDRWQELEQRPTAPVIPQTLPEALRLAADLAEQNTRITAEKAVIEAKALVLEYQVDEMAPKAKALDRLSNPSDGAVCLRVAAKLLQIPEKQFLHVANAEGFIFRNHHSRVWQGYSDKQKAGLVELKVTTVERDDGSTKTVEQALITRAGLAKLAQIIERQRAH